MSAIYHESELPSFFPGKLNFDYFDQVIDEELKLNTCFISLGSGWYKYEAPCKDIKFQAPFWDDNYMTDHHKLKNHPVLFGVSW